MYVRQFGYQVARGYEEKAAELCGHFVEALRERGVRAYVLAANRFDSTLHVVEEYLSLDSMYMARAALECDEGYRAAACAWAAEFFPLVRAALPAVVVPERLAA